MEVGFDRPERPDWGGLPPETPLVAAPHLHMEVRNGEWWLASPLAPGRARIRGGAAFALVEALAGGAAAAREGGAALALALLRAAGLVASADAVPDPWPWAGTWELHDLLLHTRSRMDHGGGALGGTYRHGRDRAPLPVHKPARGPQLPLPEPAAPSALAGLLAERRSRYDRASEPVTLEELSTLLHRSAGIVQRPTPGDSVPYAVALRPYPSGGACHPLECYLLVDRCRGLGRGVYHYDPEGHQLEEVGGDEVVHRWFAAYGWGLQERLAVGGSHPPGPDLLLVLTARVFRTQFKYEGLAYALILKEVGAFMQTVYLVATEMGLAPCALGTGPDRAFEAASDASFLVEPVVGEIRRSPR